MIIVELRGGVGNQLFQYTAALLAARGVGQEIKAETSYYSYVPGRAFALDKLFLPVDITVPFAFPLETLLSLPAIGSCWKYIYPAVGTFNLYQEKKQYIFDSYLDTIKVSTYLSGYWQHRKYVDLVAAELIKSLIFPSLPITGQKLTDRIKKTQSVAVHVRRGDYVTHPSFQVCSPEYLHNAIAYNTSHVKNPHFFFFSDDISWCKKEFGLQPNITYVENLDNEIDDLHLMSLCKHHTIANSTYSWWGARLKTQKGIVIAPKNWCGNAPAANALLYDSWTQVG